MQSNLLKAIETLKTGGLVAFPTETVYGLGADANNEAAIRKIFIAKGRPFSHPLIVHIGSLDQLTEWAIEISNDAWLLAKHFWPGPLTLILKKSPHVLDLITGGQDSVGLRIPNHPVALELLNAIKIGLAAPSANRFGRISPTTAEAVREELGDKVDYVLEGGHCAVGLESTILDMRGDDPVILRPGMITANQIEKVLGKEVIFQKKNSIRVSGNLESHYAPRTPLHLLTQEQLLSFLENPDSTMLPSAVITRQDLKIKEGVLVIKLSKHPEEYAYSLYQTLRDLDKRNLNSILVEDVPSSVEWDAIRDRLVKASQIKS